MVPVQTATSCVHLTTMLIRGKLDALLEVVGENHNRSCGLRFGRATMDRTSSQWSSESRLVVVVNTEKTPVGFVTGCTVKQS